MKAMKGNQMIQQTDTVELGQVVATPAAMEKFGLDQVNTCLMRHRNKDWGDLDKEDSKQNDEALINGDNRLFSSYWIGDEELWIITEWDRSVTTILLPKDY